MCDHHPELPTLTGRVPNAPCRMRPLGEGRPEPGSIPDDRGWGASAGRAWRIYWRAPGKRPPPTRDVPPKRESCPATKYPDRLLLDVHPRDSARDHELLNLSRALEDVVDRRKAALGSQTFCAAGSRVRRSPVASGSLGTLLTQVWRAAPGIEAAAAAQLASDFP